MTVKQIEKRVTMLLNRFNGYSNRVPLREKVKTWNEIVGLEKELASRL